MAIKIIKKSCETFRVECPHCFAILEYGIYDVAHDMQCPCCSNWFRHIDYAKPIRESEGGE